MNSKKRIVILCESYASIAYPLYRLTNESKDIQATIFIPTLKDLYHLFQIINEKVFRNELELIYYPEYSQRWTEGRRFKKLVYVLPDILGERRHLKKFYNRYFAGLENADIMFPSPGFSGAKIYFLRRLSQRNRLVFIDPGPPYMSRYSPRSINDIATLLIYKMVYGKDTQLGQFPQVNPWSKGFPLMPESFMKKSVGGVIDWSNRDEIMADFTWEKFRLFDTSNYKVIYFHQDLVDRDVPDRDTFSRELKSIFDVVRRHYPEKEIARKYHPGHELNKDVIEVGKELPVYIPAEMLYDKKVQIYLGISSNAIFSVRGGQAISLINLISFKSKELKKQQIEWMTKASRSAILFPSSLEELERMIIDISGKNL
ncbi:MAG: hypothetical protein HY325_03130 [Chloroflexi bacterium]|nr:hypothetical protein [Chloroflexota bacterium]